MRRRITIGLLLAFCLLIVACSAKNDIAPVEHEPPADVSQVAPIMPQSPSPPPQNIIPHVAPPEPAGDDEQPFCYSNYIGIWRGYAIATFYTLVITDVIEKEMTFLFVHPLHLCAMGGGQSFASPVYTMPIIDNQITLSENRTLTFYENYIILRISSSDGNHEWQWNLRRISN